MEERRQQADQALQDAARAGDMDHISRSGGEPLWLGMPSVSPVPQVGPITGSLVPRAKPLHWPVCGLRHDESEAACF